jgi:hypothetical protein
MEQGVACAHLLSRRGYSVTLHYGAALHDAAVGAHVWLVSGDLDITGCDIAHRFVSLAKFPSVSDR